MLVYTELEFKKKCKLLQDRIEKNYIKEFIIEQRGIGHNRISFIMYIKVEGKEKIQKGI